MLHGAPVTTFDLDVVHARDHANIARLLAALEELAAVYRAQPERQLRPGHSHLASPGRQLLLTRFGPLGVLGMIGTSRTWEDLRGHARTMEIAVSYTHLFQIAPIGNGDPSLAARGIDSQVAGLLARQFLHAFRHGAVVRIALCAQACEDHGKVRRAE